MSDFQDSSKIIRRLIIHIEVVENQIDMDYFPNKTSIKKLVEMYGFEMDAWKDKTFYLKVLDMIVRGEPKKVLYVVEKPSEEYKPVLE